MPDIFLWSVILVVGILLLVRGADWFVDGAKALGATLGMSRFAVGVLIVGFGTSLPEFTSSLVGALQGTPEIVLANVIGSNIANILLIIGLLVVIGGSVVVKQDLIRTELPVFFIATTHFLFAVWDGQLDRIEALLLLGTFAAYMWYLFIESREGNSAEAKETRPPLSLHSIGLIVVGLAALIGGAKLSVDMIVTIGSALSVPIGFITITVLAIGTSLPELFVSLRAAMRKEHDLAIGNIFGSNAFNALFVAGVPGLFFTLDVDHISAELGVPVLLAASAILFVAGLSRRIMRWEGIMLLLFFGFFMAKLITYL